MLIAYDRDEPGDHAAAKLAEKLIAHNIECYRIQCPHGTDINDYALAVKPAPKSLEVLIRSAQWMGSGRGGQRPQQLTASSQPPAQDELPSSTQADCQTQQPLKAAKEDKCVVGDADVCNPADREAQGSGKAAKPSWSDSGHP